MKLKLEFTETFRKAAKNLPIVRAKKVNQTLKRFIENPNLSGLRFHKLEGVDAYSLSAGRKDRIIMKRIETDGVVVWTLVDVGAHDHVYRRTNRR